MRELCARAQHVFDFVAFRKTADRKTVAVKVLTPTYGSTIQARNYGFLALDLKDMDAGKWPRIAVIAKAEQWNVAALDLVRAHSFATLPVRTRDTTEVSAVLPQLMDQVAA